MYRFHDFVTIMKNEDFHNPNKKSQKTREGYY